MPARRFHENQAAIRPVEGKKNNNNKTGDRTKEPFFSLVFPLSFHHLPSTLQCYSERESEGREAGAHAPPGRRACELMWFFFLAHPEVRQA